MNNIQSLRCEPFFLEERSQNFHEHLQEPKKWFVFNLIQNNRLILFYIRLVQIMVGFIVY